MNKKSFVLLILTNLVVVTPVFAVDYVQTLSVSATEEFDSNPRMSENNAKSVWLSKVNPKYKLSRFDDIDEQYAQVNYLLQRSSNELLSIKRDDPSLDLGWKRTFQRGNAEIKFHYDEASTRSSELDESGDIVGDASKVTRDLSLNGVTSLSERWDLNFGAGYSNIDYLGQTTLSGYDTRRVNGKLQYQWLDALAVYTSVAFTNQERSTGTTNVTNPMFGLNWDASEKLVLGVSGGFNKSTGDSGGGTGLAWGSNLKYTGERQVVNVDASRSLSPSGANGFIESDRLKLSWNYDVNDLYSVRLDYSINKNNSINKTEIQTYKVSVDRDISQLWQAKLYAGTRESQNDVRDASAYIVGFTIRYNHPDF